MEKKEDQLIEAAKYGYNYHANTQFPNKPFEENCKNNFLQWLSSKQYHSSNDSVEGIKDKFYKAVGTGDLQNSTDILDIDKAWNWFLPHLKQQESDAVKWSEVHKLYEKYCDGDSPSECLSFYEWIKTEPYQLFKSNNNGNT